MRWKWGRRSARAVANGDTDTAGVPTTEERTGDQGHVIRSARALHAFNRYEIKYLVDVRTAALIRDELAGRMDTDSFGTHGYGVWSVYYDTRGLRFYWEKIDGLRFRRKLRIRHYGDPAELTDDSEVFVEIKQRVDRVTQKRRVPLTYRQARRLCDQRAPVEDASASPAFLNEVRELVSRLDLRPVTMTGYHREAFVGRDADLGLRVTLDRRVRGRDRDLRLGMDAENRLLLSADTVVIEVKANERVPYWLTELTARRNLRVHRLSKYCQSVEAFDMAPRSVFHVPEEHRPSPIVEEALVEESSAGKSIVEESGVEKSGIGEPGRGMRT